MLLAANDKEGVGDPGEVDAGQDHALHPLLVDLVNRHLHIFNGFDGDPREQPMRTIQLGLVFLFEGGFFFFLNSLGLEMVREDNV